MLSPTVKLCCDNGWGRADKQASTHRVCHHMLKHAEVPADRHDLFLQAIAREHMPFSIYEETERFAMFFDLSLRDPSRAALDELRVLCEATARAFYPTLQGAVELVEMLAADKVRLLFPHLVVDAQKALLMYEHVVSAASRLATEETRASCGARGQQQQRGLVYDPTWREVFQRQVYVEPRVLLGAQPRKRCTGAPGKRCSRACEVCQGFGFVDDGTPLRCESDKSLLDQLRLTCRGFDPLSPGWVLPECCPTVPLAHRDGGAPRLVDEHPSEGKFRKKKPVHADIAVLIARCIQRYGAEFRETQIASHCVDGAVVPSVYPCGKEQRWVAFVRGAGSSCCPRCSPGAIYFELSRKGIRLCCWRCKFKSAEWRDISKGLCWRLKIPAKYQAMGPFKRLQEEILPRLDAMRRGDANV